KKLIDKVGNRVIDIESCVTELQTFLKVRFPGSEFQRSLSNYGQPGSPIVLKNDFRTFITTPEMDKQVNSKKKNLLGWLRKRKPKTGLDAQDHIAYLVESDEIEKYLNLTKYKQNLYQKGKTSRDAHGILAVYLFEILIPELHLPDGKKKPKRQ
ncbi:MAG: hypothetical protein AAB656_04445, partial [Patescibacteria group bacterium]